MNYISTIQAQLSNLRYAFQQPPIIIGGVAMEYYGMRKAGADIDLVVCDADYQALAKLHPEHRREIYGDLGVMLPPFEIWRSIALLDYDFFSHKAIDFEQLRMISFERLLFTRVAAMNDAQKYHDDLMLCKDYVYKRYQNKEFL